MNTAVRLAVVAGLLGMWRAGAWRYRSWKGDATRDRAPSPRLPSELVGGAPRTWVIFTTKFCVSCDSVEAQLRAAEPASRIVRVGAERDPLLTRTFRVRSAPTVLLSDGTGEVRARLVGPEAVTAYLRDPIIS